mmetsp:Transcript_112749/g.221030  ORF Transcript_112749/g.221030 Transcript_112749/m.221030 type:complete len:218 (-) Transcript_112749:92-745(-)
MEPQFGDVHDDASDPLHQQEGHYDVGEEFSLNKLSSIGSDSHHDDILARLEAFTKKYEQMTLDVREASKVIERSSRFAESVLRSAVFLQCRRKLQNVHQAMGKVDIRILTIQQKLNSIRRQLPARKHSLVESGPFYYKCIYPGGVRYRDYPSINAKVVGADAIVTHNQVIEIAERVFIASEHSVFLHNRGVGWLFENKKEIICFQRVMHPQNATLDI